MRTLSTRPLRLGAGAGYSGDRIAPAVDLAERGGLDYLVFECLAERTIALAQLERSRDPESGFDPLLRERMQAVLAPCVRNGTRIITNMGAAHPMAAGREIIRVARELGLQRLKVCVVHGDDVLAQLRGRDLRILETGEPLAALGDSLLSANAYLGAAPLVQALAQGADVVVTGRVADPALFLAPLVHAFGWHMDDWEKLGQGTLVGHLLECAGQITGGYFADPGFRDVPDLAALGFPIAEVHRDGRATITKLPDTGGCVTVDTCIAQLLYEVEDPGRYLQPDVVADFSGVRVAQAGTDRVELEGARGYARPDCLKVTVGYRGGFVGEGQVSYAGPGAQARGQLALDVLRQRLDDAGIRILDSRYELIGVDAIHGPGLSAGYQPYEVRARVACRVPTRHEAQRVANEVEAMYLNGPASGGGIAKTVREVIAGVSVLIPREWVRTGVTTMEL